MKSPKNEGIKDHALARLRAMFPSLSPAEKKIAEYINENYKKVVQMTLAEVALNSGVSDATAVRFFRALGYKRWMDFKIGLYLSTNESTQMINKDLDPEDDIKGTSYKILQNVMQALQDTYAVMKPSELQQTTNMMLNAKRILIIGAGTSAPVAQNLHNCLFRLGMDCKVETDPYLQIMQSALFTEEDLVIAISRTGESDIAIRTVKVAKNHSCPVICITGNKLSGLAKLSDIVLLSVSHETLQEAPACRIAQHFLVYSIYINLAMDMIEEMTKNERLIWNALIHEDFINTDYV